MISRRTFLQAAAATPALIAGTTEASAQRVERPNILWIVLEDLSPWIGCYGDPINKDATPTIDALAARGVRFDRAFVSAAVCSPCRSALITGAHQSKIGVHNHRSSVEGAPIHLPEAVELLPALLKREGYYTFNAGKTDYNFVWDTDATYSASSPRGEHRLWKNRAPGQPFFGQIQMIGGKGNDTLPEERQVKPEDVKVFPDYPDNEIYRAVFAQHYNRVRNNDDEVAAILRDLEADGLLDTTIIFYFSDHGAPHLLRHKQMPTEGGLHVPLIVTGPGIPAGEIRRDLVSSLDIAATTAALAGQSIPKHYDGANLFARDYRARESVISGRDRCDSTIEFVRSVRTDRFRYTRNFLRDRVFLQPQYRDGRDYTDNLRELYASGELAPHLIDIYFGERPAEELYDVGRDPHQIKNLANDPTFSQVLAEHRAMLEEWMRAVDDKGKYPESDASLAYWGAMEQWTPGNPEYERVRQDSDGDGLSDEFERYTGRDPEDGVMHWHFDCGGWQTEGWEPVADVTNLPGRQGFLEFDLLAATAAIERQGLRLDTAKNQGALAVTMRSTHPLELRFAWRRAGERGYPHATAWSGLVPSLNFPDTLFDLVGESAWKGTVEAVRLDFKSAPGCVVEIDTIRVR